MTRPSNMLANTPDPGTITWFWAAAATIIATLASIVTMLYKAQISMKDAAIDAGKIREESLKQELNAMRKIHEEAIEKLTEEIEECRKDREDLRVQMARFETRLAMLEKSEKNSEQDKSSIRHRLDDLERDA